MDNLAQEGYKENFGYEILNEKIVNMAPASTGHVTVSGNIYRILWGVLRGKKCRAFADGLMVHFSEKDKVVPDVMVICHPEIIKESGVYGAPDLVVEVLSPNTAFNDKGYKKSLYESNGVREYWIVDPKSCIIEVYQRVNEKFELNQVYARHAPEDMTLLTDAEREKLPQSVQSCIFPDLFIPLEDIFEDL